MPILLILIAITALMYIRSGVYTKVDEYLYGIVKENYILHYSWYSSFEYSSFMFDLRMWRYWTGRSMYKKLTGIQYSIK